VGDATGRTHILFRVPGGVSPRCPMLKAPTLRVHGKAELEYKNARHVGDDCDRWQTVAGASRLARRGGTCGGRDWKHISIQGAGAE
jgi:hypothetical protein